MYTGGFKQQAHAVRRSSLRFIANWYRVDIFRVSISDPYVRISFGNQSQVSEIIHRTLCPTWDQTLIFENVYIYGSTEITETSPPHVVMELFDQDMVVSCSK